MAFCREYRGQKHRLRADCMRMDQFAGVMASGGDYSLKRYRLRQVRRHRRRQMQSGGAAFGGKARIARNQKTHTAAAAQAGERFSLCGSRRVVVIAVDNRRAGRQDADDQFRASYAASVGQEGERKRRRISVARAFEGPGRRC